MAAKGCILLVDDEESLLRLMTVYLSRLGYSVTGCSSGAEARSAVEAAPEQYMAAVVDLTLPDCQGDALALDFMRVSPTLRVLMCSGYPLACDSFPDELQGRVAVLQKPFLPNALACKLDRLLTG